MLTYLIDYTMPFMNVYQDLQESSQRLKEKAIDEYKVALKLPRKQKKKAKKSALFLYSIACWGEKTFDNIFN